MGSMEIDIICESCQRKVTLVEIMEGFHEEHTFAPLERAAMLAVQDYLRGAGISTTP